MAAGQDMLEVARAYEELAAIAGELAEAVEARRPRERRAPAGTRAPLGLGAPASSGPPCPAMATRYVRLVQLDELFVPSQIDGCRRSS